MNKKLFLPCVLVLVVLLSMACSAKSPAVGEWKSDPTDFGDFSFTVNEKGTGVPSVEYHLKDFPCGGGTQSGTIGNSFANPEESAPIEEGKFTFEGSSWVIEGSFDSSGKSASGTWKNLDCVANGKWTAKPAKK